RSRQAKPGRRVFDPADTVAAALSRSNEQMRAFQVMTTAPSPGGPTGPQMIWKEEDAVRWTLANRGPEEGVSWFDPATGAFGQLIVVRVYTQGDARACKAYRGWRMREGKRSVVEGTGCQDATGRWAPE